MGNKAVAALIALIIVAGSIPSAFAGNGSRYLYVSTYIFENRGDEAFDITEDDATIPLFHSDGWQKVSVLNATHSLVREYIDVDGNSLAVFDLPSVPPSYSLQFSITFSIESYDRPAPEIDFTDGEPISSIPPRLVEEFCVESDTFTVGDLEIQELARKLAADEATAIGAVTRLVGWLVDNVSYRHEEVPLYPNETLAMGGGDCDDQAILLITMCRALGIPAVLQVGVVFLESIDSERSSWGGHLSVVQHGMGWHGWALVYVPPWGWLPVDLTMVKSRDPLSRITEAPVYGRSIVTCFNVSKLEYVGDGRRSRARLMSSDIYVTVSDSLVSSTAINEKDDAKRTMTPYLILGLSAAAVAVAAIFLLSRRRTI